MTKDSTQSEAGSARFPGLDALRTILALVVICSHVEDCKVYFPAFPKLGLHAFFLRCGYEAVQCFFVLSGFLITYLLLQEQEKTGQIRVRRFYWKRVLRIWPLYYAITLLGFFLLPNVVNLAAFPNVMQSFHQGTWWQYALIVPNLSLLMYPIVLGASHLWSIGIEEQFYLFWPWVVRACKKHLALILLICIVSKPVCVVLLNSAVSSLSRHGYIQSSMVLTFLAYAQIIWKLFPFEALACGGMFAWLVHSRNDYWQRLLGLPISQVISWGALIAWQLAPVPPLYEWHYQLPIAGFIYGLAVWNIGANPRTLVGLRARWLNQFGMLTYSIYMWHVLVIIAVFSAVNAFDLIAKVSPWVFQTVLFSSVIGLSLAVAQLSFTWFEMPFLNLKNRWFGHSSESPRLNTLPILASIPNILPYKIRDNYVDRERKSGNQAA